MRAKGSAADPAADLRDAQLANAESDRLDALEEAELAAENAGSYQREVNRLRHQVRDLEAQLRTERHEHAETRARLERASRSAPGAGTAISATYPLVACVFLIARFVVENPISQVGFAVAAFLLMVAFVLSPRRSR